MLTALSPALIFIALLSSLSPFLWVTTLICLLNISLNYNPAVMLLSAAIMLVMLASQLLSSGLAASSQIFNSVKKHLNLLLMLVSLNFILNSDQFLAQLLELILTQQSFNNQILLKMTVNILNLSGISFFVISASGLLLEIGIRLIAGQGALSSAAIISEQMYGCIRALAITGILLFAGAQLLQFISLNFINY